MNWWIKSTKRFVQLQIVLSTFLFFASTITGCVSISTFASLVGIPVGITSSAIGLEICAITSGIKNLKLIIK